MTLRDLYQYCKEVSLKYPSLTGDIMGFYDLAEMEIEGGSSVEHECELAVSDIEDLISK